MTSHQNLFKDKRDNCKLAYCSCLHLKEHENLKEFRKLLQNQTNVRNYNHFTSLANIQTFLSINKRWAKPFSAFKYGFNLFTKLNHICCHICAHNILFTLGHRSTSPHLLHRISRFAILSHTWNQHYSNTVLLQQLKHQLAATLLSTIVRPMKDC